MQLAELFLRNIRRRAHHQVLGALVHREQRHFAQILHTAQQHHDVKKAFAIAGYEESTLEQRFGGMLHALSLGAPPHGGIAPGIDLSSLRRDSTGH